MLASDLVTLPIAVTLGAIAGILGASIAVSMWLTRNGASTPRLAADRVPEVDG
jgi:hypothetical protein